MSTKPKDGGPAFPCADFKMDVLQTGMTLRDWFAGQALAGLRALSDDDAGGMDYSNFAATAYKQADAMLAARNAE